MNYKPSIAIIVPGGIGTGHNNIGVPVLERLVRLLARDYQVTVFSLFKVNSDYVPDAFEVISVTSANPLIRSLKFLTVFRKYHQRRKFEIVHGFWAMPSGFLAVLAGKIFRIKSIVSLLGGDAISLPEINYGQLQRWLPRKLILWTLEQTDIVICLTQYLLHNLKSAGLKRGDVRIIPWGIDTTLFAFRKKQLETPVQFLHIANLHPVKDQVTLLRAFKIISDKVPSRLTIIGEGVSSNKVNSLIKELNLESVVTILSAASIRRTPTTLPPC